METIKVPYELLVRWNQTGALAGAHVQWRYVTRDGEATVGETLGTAEPIMPSTVAGTIFATLLSSALTDALGQVATLTAERDALAAERDALALQLAQVGQPPVTDPRQAYADAVQRHMDATVRVRNYDGILSACTYATSTVPQYAAEGQACVAWRDAVWVAAYAVLAEVESGTRPAPSVEALIAELPTLVWPS